MNITIIPKNAGKVIDLEWKSIGGGLTLKADDYSIIRINEDGTLTRFTHIPASLGFPIDDRGRVELGSDR